jgi:glycine amidinotransferase/scyllo-inosamine-4-phosphate amidinotransferase 1
MIRALESRKFTVVPVRMRHCYTMLGGLHCTTLDVVRASTLRSYATPDAIAPK